jgi:hypothetical protein
MLGTDKVFLQKTPYKCLLCSESNLQSGPDMSVVENRIKIASAWLGIDLRINREKKKELATTPNYKLCL